MARGGRPPKPPGPPGPPSATSNRGGNNNRGSKAPFGGKRAELFNHRKPPRKGK